MARSWTNQLRLTTNDSNMNEPTWFPISVCLVHIVRSPRLDSQLHPLVAESRWCAVRSLTVFSGEDSRAEKSWEPAIQKHPDSEHEAFLS